jgi:hypothetical protein
MRVAADPEPADLFAQAGARLAERRQPVLGFRVRVNGVIVVVYRFSGSAGAYPVQSEQGCGYRIVLVPMWPSHSHLMRHHPSAPRPGRHDCQPSPNRPPSPGQPPLRVRVPFLLSLLIQIDDGLPSEKVIPIGDRSVWASAGAGSCAEQAQGACGDGQRGDRQLRRLCGAEGELLTTTAQAVVVSGSRGVRR